MRHSGATLRFEVFLDTLPPPLLVSRFLAAGTHGQQGLQLSYSILELEQIDSGGDAAIENGDSKSSCEHECEQRGDELQGTQDRECHD